MRKDGWNAKWYTDTGNSTTSAWNSAVFMLLSPFWNHSGAPNPPCFLAKTHFKHPKGKSTTIYRYDTMHFPPRWPLPTFLREFQTALHHRPHCKLPSCGGLNSLSLVACLWNHPNIFHPKLYRKLLEGLHLSLLILEKLKGAANIGSTWHSNQTVNIVQDITGLLLKAFAFHWWPRQFGNDVQVDDFNARS